MKNKWKLMKVRKLDIKLKIKPKPEAGTFYPCVFFGMWMNKNNLI